MRVDADGFPCRKTGVSRETYVRAGQRMFALRGQSRMFHVKHRATSQVGMFHVKHRGWQKPKKMFHVKHRGWEGGLAFVVEG